MSTFLTPAAIAVVSSIAGACAQTDDPDARGAIAPDDLPATGTILSPGEEPTVTGLETVPAPAMTAIPTPEGASLLSPDYRVEGDIAAETLASGEYIVALNLDALSEAGLGEIWFVSWDDEVQGRLMHLESTGDSEGAQVFGSLVSFQAQRWFVDLRDPNGLLAIDAADEMLWQFGFGCDGTIRPPYLGPKYLVYRCSAEADDFESDSHWFIVSLEDWTIVAITTLPREMFAAGWSGDQIDFVGRLDGTDDPNFCQAAAPRWEVECRSMPFQVRTTSPDGTWVWVHTDQPEAPIALVRRSCLQDGVDDCELLPIEPASGQSWSDVSVTDLFASWSPDSRKLLILAACSAGVFESLLWVYQIDTGVSGLQRRSMDCDLFPYNDLTLWSGDSSRLVVLSGTDEVRPLILSLEKGTIVKELPANLEVMGLLEVP